MYREQYGEYAQWHKGVEVFREMQSTKSAFQSGSLCEAKYWCFFFMKDMD